MNYIFTFYCNKIKFQGTWEFMAGFAAATQYSLNRNKYTISLENNFIINERVYNDFKIINDKCIPRDGWIMYRVPDGTKLIHKYYCHNRDFIDGFRTFEKYDLQVDVLIKNGKREDGIIFISKNGQELSNYRGVFSDWTEFITICNN